MSQRSVLGSSTEQRLADLEADVGWLLRKVQQLSDEKEDLLEEVHHLRYAVGKNSREEELEREDSSESFSLVYSAPAASSFEPAAPTRNERLGGARARGIAASNNPYRDVGVQAEPEVPVRGSNAPIPTRSERESIARGIGEFFKKSIAGEAVHRNNSGRELLPLHNRYYVVIRDFDGGVGRYARVFYSWAPAKVIVAKDRVFGDSVFCGFATLWEAEIAVREAGYCWPGKEHWGYNGR